MININSNKIFWLASYPKSGNTWMRAFLTSYLYSINGEFNDFSLLEKIIKFESSRFFSLIIKKELLLNKQTKISEYWLKSQIEILKYAKSTVFLKTHNFCGAINNNQFTNSDLSEGFIYLVRDPRAVAVSFSNHTEESIDQVIDSMISEKPRYVLSGGYPSWYFNWKVNYSSWKNFLRKVSGMIIKYEDLFNENKFMEVAKLLDSLNIYKFDLIKFYKSINSVTFENLSILEKKYGFEESGKNKFFFKGRIDYWKKILNSNQIDRIEKNLESEMKELGYLT